MKKKIFLLALGLIVFVSCQKTDRADALDPNALLISAEIASEGEKTRSNPVGESVDARTSFLVGDKISVETLTELPIIYTLGAEGWTSDSYLLWEGDNMTVQAYYPHDASVDKFTLPVNQSTITGIAKADYMVYDKLASRPAEGAPLALTLERQTARVIVNIVKFSDEFSNPDDMVLQSLYIGSEYDKVDRIYAAQPTMITPYATVGSGTVVGGINSQYQALVLPGFGNATTDFIRVRVNNTDLKVTGIPAMEAGHSYTYNLTVGKNKVTLGSVQVNDWATDGINVSDQVTEYIEPAEVGDYFYSNGKWSTERIEGLDIIGIVYVVNPDKLSGKVISTEQSARYANIKWSTEAVYYDAFRDFDNGLLNMRTAITKSADLSTFPAFQWVDNLNKSSNIDPKGYADGVKGVWYFPAYNEIDDYFDLSKYNPNPQVREKVNSVLRGLGLPIVIDEDDRTSLWTSSESGVYGYFVSYTGYSGTQSKTSSAYVRGVMLF